MIGVEDAELARGAKGLIRMENDQTILEPPEVSSSSSKAMGKKPQVFSFGECECSPISREPARALLHPHISLADQASSSGSSVPNPMRAALM
jgi:hypothetical protein